MGAPVNDRKVTKCPCCGEVVKLVDEDITRLYLERVGRNIPLRTLAKMTDLTTRCILNCEKAKTKPQKLTAERIAKALDYDGEPEELFEVVL